ncbi:MAG: dTMP kinase [Anaerolineae bacterium]
MFITFEGPDGSGKTTQARLLAEHLRRGGTPVVLTREPGGTPIGDQVRGVLHNPTNVDMTPEAEFLLYSASRAQLVRQIIFPALVAGKWVISDRYFDSSLAYQGYARGLDVGTLWEITRFATGGLMPDLTIYLDIQPNQGLERRLLGGGEWNRLDQEALAFHHRVRAGYLELAGQEPHRWLIIDAAKPVDVLQAEIRALLQERL